MFKDQSQSVIEKATAQQVKKPLKRSKIPFEQDWSAIDEHSLSPSLDVPVEEKAQCFFMFHFGGGYIIPMREGMLDRGLDKDEISRAPSIFNELDSVFGASLRAASFASYANYTRNPMLKEAALRQYLEAIRLTNQALTSQSDAKKDRTLLSINLLGIFEILNGSTKRSLQDWAGHVQGAAALIKLRGREQFRTAIGRRAFLQIASSMLACCLQWGMRMPDHILELARCLADEANDGQWESGAFLIMLEFNQFRHNVRNGIVVDPQEIVDGALQLDHRLLQTCDTSRPNRQYDVYVNPRLDPELVYHGRYHVYPRTSVAKLWNSIRVLRILVHQQVLQVSLGHPERAAQVRKSAEICRTLQSDILSSVPHQIGYLRVVPIPPSDDSRHQDAPAEIVGSMEGASQNGGTGKVAQSQIHVNGRAVETHIFSDSTLKPSLSGFALLWPLRVAGMMRTSGDDVRAYCVKTFQNIGLKMGISHAMVLGNAMTCDGRCVN